MVGFVGLLLLTVNEAAEVRLSALATFVERAAFESIFLLLSIIVVSFSGHTSIAEDTLLLGTQESHLLNLTLHDEEGAKDLSDWLAVKDIDGSLASRAAHEAEADSEGGISVLEKLDDAIYVKDVTAAKLSTWFFLEFAGVADATKLVLFRKVALDAASVKAGQDLLLAFHSEASMSALLVNFVGELQFLGLFRHFAGVDHLHLFLFFFNLLNWLLRELEDGNFDQD